MPLVDEPILIVDTPVYRISWLDGDAKTIIVTELLAPWAWDDVHMVTEITTPAMLSVSHPVYEVVHVYEAASKVPRGNGFPTIMRAINNDVPSQRMVVAVMPKSMLLRSLVNTATRVAKRIEPNTLLVHWVKTLDEALTLIEADKAIVRGIIDRDR